MRWKKNPKTGVAQWFATFSLGGKHWKNVALDPSIPRWDLERANRCEIAVREEARRRLDLEKLRKDTAEAVRADEKRASVEKVRLEKVRAENEISALEIRAREIIRESIASLGLANTARKFALSTESILRVGSGAGVRKGTLFQIVGTEK